MALSVCKDVHPHTGPAFHIDLDFSDETRWRIDEFGESADSYESYRKTQ